MEKSEPNQPAVGTEEKDDLKVKVQKDEIGEQEELLVNKISQGAAVRLIGRIAHIHHIDVRLHVRAT